MRTAAAPAPPAADPSDPRLESACLQSERLAHEIVASALEDAERIVSSARQVADARERELVRRAAEVSQEYPLLPVDTQAAEVLLAGAKVQSGAILQRAIDRSTRVRQVADAQVEKIEKESRRRRRRLERELQALVRERDRVVRELSARVTSVRTAGQVARRDRNRTLRAGLIGAVVVAIAVIAGIAGWELSSGQSPPPALAAPAAQPTSTHGVCPIPTRFRPAFVAAARQERVPLALLTSVAAVESHFHAGLRSAAGAYGLMQLMPQTGRDLGIDRYRWRANVFGGARLLRQMLVRFGGNTPLALAAYNAGPTRVESGTVPLETLRYVAAVTTQRAAIAGCG